MALSLTVAYFHNYGIPGSYFYICFTTANPRGLELVLPQCFEDKEVISFKSYFGGIEGSGEYIWYRTLRKLKGLELSDVSAASEDVITVGNSV